MAPTPAFGPRRSTSSVIPEGWVTDVWALIPNAATIIEFALPVVTLRAVGDVLVPVLFDDTVGELAPEYAAIAWAPDNRELDVQA